MGDYDWVTQAMFDDELEELIGEQDAKTLLFIPGIYETLSEHFNNDVLERLERYRPENKVEK
jgi:hypothetical protein